MLHVGGVALTEAQVHGIELLHLLGHGDHGDQLRIEERVGAHGLVQRTAPHHIGADGGESRLMHDQSGNVVLEQDANAAVGEADPNVLGGDNEPIARPWFRRMHYDVFNRPVKQERLRLYHPATVTFGAGCIISYPANPLAYANSTVDFNDPNLDPACWPADAQSTVPCYHQPFSSAATLSFLARLTVLTRATDPNASPPYVPIALGIDPLPPDPVLNVCLPPLETASVQPLLTDAILEKTWAYDNADVAASATVPVSNLHDGVESQLLNERDKLRGRLSHAVSYPHRLWTDFSTWPATDQSAAQYDFRSYDAEGHIAWQLQQFNAAGITAENKGQLARLDYPHYDLLGNLRTVNVDVGHDGQLDMQQHYAYDDWGRLLKVYLNVNDEGANGNPLAEFKYDLARGVLNDARYHAEQCASPGSAEQVGGYSLEYDLRDRLTKITGPHYTEHLRYDAATTSHPVAGTLVGDQHYNGSINALEHHYTLDAFANYANTGFEEPKRYAYRYDGLGRLTRADAVQGDLVVGVSDPYDARFRVGDEYDALDRIGRRTKRHLAPLIDTLLLAEAHSIRTDGLDIYHSLVPRSVHRALRFGTNGIERMNLTLRTRLKRLARRTICYSKCSAMLHACVVLACWG